LTCGSTYCLIKLNYFINCEVDMWDPHVRFDQSKFLFWIMLNLNNKKKFRN
jgi:hypothetical protein